MTGDTGPAAFETPENVTVHYELAGLGTRFTAWVFDAILLTAGYAVLFVFLLVVAALASAAGGGSEAAEPPAAVIISVAIVVFGFIPIAYFAFFEQIMGGQTPGKRAMRLRVVMAEGFSLTFTAVVLRNIFRLADTIPLLWIVPFANGRYQRLGDMVAGTLVVHEQPPRFQELHAHLLQRPEADAVFRFTPAQLSRLVQADWQALERFLDRSSQVPPHATAALEDRMAQALATRMDLATPGDEERRRFLEDLLAAHLRRQMRELG